MAYYTQGQGLISQRRGNASYFYNYDGLGSTKALTDANQNIQASYKYDAWGNVLQTSGTVTNPYLYVGELGYYADGDSGMYLLTQRWYNLVVGRFVVRDPLFKQAVHFSYCLSNPQRFTDASGLIWDANYCFESLSRCLNSAGARECISKPGHSSVVDWVRFGGCAIGCGIIGAISQGWPVAVRCFIVCSGASWLVEIGTISPSESYNIESESCKDAFRWCCYMVKKHNWSDELGICSDPEKTLNEFILPIKRKWR